MVHMFVTNKLSYELPNFCFLSQVFVLSIDSKFSAYEDTTKDAYMHHKHLVA